MPKLSVNKINHNVHCSVQWLLGNCLSF